MFVIWWLGVLLCVGMWGESVVLSLFLRNLPSLAVGEVGRALWLGLFRNAPSLGLGFVLVFEIWSLKVQSRSRSDLVLVVLVFEQVLLLPLFLVLEVFLVLAVIKIMRFVYFFTGSEIVFDF